MPSYIRSAPLFYQLDWSPSPGRTTRDRLKLDGDEAKHAMNARRLREGDAIEVSNGRGAHGTGVVESTSSRPAELVLRIDEISHHAQEGIELVLASALPKGERQSTLLDMATQLGMRRFVPLECDLSSVQFQSKMTSRWERILLSACKQSRRMHLPEIDQDCSLEELLMNVDDLSLVVYGDQQGDRISGGAEAAMKYVKHVIAVIGPEAGFSKIELGLLREHPRAFAITASPHILRTETAAVALLTLANQLSTSS